MAPESTSMTDTGGPGGTTVGGNVAEAGEAVANKIETFEELMGPKGRYRLRELAQTMKESGALRIKDHRTIQGNFPNSFKGECASVIPTMAVALVQFASAGLPFRSTLIVLQAGGMHDCTQHSICRDAGMPGTGFWAMRAQ